MLGKLMKYEFKATGRIFLPMFGALLIISIVNRLFVHMNFQVPSIIGTAVSVIMIIAICVITLILTLQRFYKNLLGNEGYLMFTLPVKTNHLIFSKLLVSTVWFIASGIIVILAILIMAFNNFNFTDIFSQISKFFQNFSIGQINLTFFIVEALVMFVLSLFSGILILYACMSVSLFVNRHRGLFAFGAFIVFSIIGQTVGSILFLIGDALNIMSIMDRFNLFGQMHTFMVMSIVCELVTCVIFFILTRYMLKNKLNLE